jgi:hypothetical protein
VLFAFREDEEDVYRSSISCACLKSQMAKKRTQQVNLIGHLMAQLTNGLARTTDMNNRVKLAAQFSNPVGWLVQFPRTPNRPTPNLRKGNFLIPSLTQSKHDKPSSFAQFNPNHPQ